MTSSVGYRRSPACHMLQLVVVMAEISLLQCYHISSAQTYIYASPSRRSITVSTGQWLPTNINTTVFGNNSVRVMFDMADPSLNIDRYRVIINRTDLRILLWDDVRYNPNGVYAQNTEGMFIGEIEFQGLEVGTYSLKLVVKPTNPEVCGVNNCRRTGYQDFIIPAVTTTHPPTSRLPANKDITTPTRPSLVPTSSSVPPPQTQTTQPFRQSVSRQHEMDSATWRVAVIAGPVAFLGLFAATAYCIRSWKTRERARLTGNFDCMELAELQNNRRNQGEHDKSVMTAPTLENHPELWKRPMKDRSLEEICQPPSTATISTAAGPIPPQHIVCDLHDIPKVIPHQWQGLYPKTPVEQLQPTPRPQFPNSDVYPVDHLLRGVDVGGELGGACSCGAACRMQALPVWKQGCPHAAPDCISGACIEMGGDHGRGISEWDDGWDNHCGILCSQEALYLESQSHLDLFKKLMAYPSRFSVASSQFTEMCDYINSSTSTQPSYDRSTPQPKPHPRQRLDHLISRRDPVLAPSMKTKLSWRDEVFMRSCPSLPEYP